MTKHDFLLSLQAKLSGFPHADTEERLHFYREMIEDRMEEGLSEEDAVSAVGSVEKIAAQVIAEVPSTATANPQSKPKRRRKVWETVLLVLGAPVWVSLLIAAFAVALSLYISAWSVILSLWVVFASLVVCGISGIAIGIGFACSGNVPSGIALLGAGFLCTGLAIFLFFGCKAATAGTVLLTKKLLTRRKRNG